MREAFIMAPGEAPDFAQNRGELWNAVEAMERRKDARLGREIQLGLAWELTHDEQRELVREFAQKELVDRGFVVDVAIHNYGRTIPAIGASEDQAERLRKWAAAVPMLERDEAEGVSDPHLVIMRNRDGDVSGYKLYQPHAHLRATPRVCKDGEFVADKKASRELNDPKQAMNWRYDWPELQNAYLERAGTEVRVSSTSVEEDQFPDIRFLGEARSREAQRIEERAAELDEAERAAHEEVRQVEAADEAFRQVHNDGIKDTFVELEDAGGSASEAGETTRLALWWHRTAERFSEWRHDFRDVAGEWRDRFEQQAWRIRSVLGWAERDPPGHGPTREIDAQGAHLKRDGPDQEPEL